MASHELLAFQFQHAEGSDGPSVWQHALQSLQGHLTWPPEIASQLEMYGRLEFLRPPCSPFTTKCQLSLTEWQELIETSQVCVDLKAPSMRHAECLFMHSCCA